MQELTPPFSEQIVQETVTSDDITNTTEQYNSCERLQCGPILSKMETAINNWIPTNLSTDNIPDLLACFQSVLNEDKHNLFEELRDVVDIIDLHNIQLCNLFDNYVCFAEDIDFEQLQLLAKAVNSRSFNRLEAKNHNHFHLTNNILHMAVKQLHFCYVKMNERIKIAEKEVTKKVNDRLLKTYKTLMVKLLSEHLRHKTIQYSHILVKNSLISIAEKCMNIGHRFNGVTKIYFLELSNHLEVMFRDLKKQCIKSECSALLIDTYMEDFLNIFYAQKEPHFLEQNVEEIIKRHNAVCENVTSQVQGVSKLCLKLRLDMHLRYITELISQEFTFRNISPTTANNPFCLHLSSQCYTLYLKANNDNTSIDISAKPQPAFVALTNQDKFVFGYKALHLTQNKAKNTKACGRICDFICDDKYGGKYNQCLIENVFKKLLLDVEESSNCKYNAIIIIIPQNFCVEDRLRLRKFARSAGVNNIFIISEVSLLAFSQICLQDCVKNGNVKVVVAIQIYDDGIRVNIFEEKSENRVQLSAAIFQPWQGSISKPSRLLHFWRSKITNPFSHTNSTSDCKLTLKGALLFAFSQVDRSVANQSIKYCLISQCSKHHHIFDDVLKGHQNWSKINQFQLGFPKKAAMYFLQNPVKLMAAILDNGVNIKYFDQIEETILKNHQKLEQTSHELNFSNDPRLLENKQRLLQRCNEMRSQLSTGSVNLRRLAKKLVTECIDRAEKIATDKNTTQEMIVAEQQELNELITEHNFS